MNQIENIKNLISKIASDNQLESPEKWTNRDFQILKSLIESKTGQIISERTIKRIVDTVFLGTDNNIPKSSTLHLLAQTAGYDDWFKFSLKQGSQSIKEVKRIRIPFLRIIATIIGIVLVIWAYFTYNTYQKKQLISNIRFTVNQKITDYPSTLSFEYFIPKNINDSVFLNIECDHAIYDNVIYSKTYLNKNNTVASHRFKEPGKYSVTLSMNGKKIKEQTVFALSNAWLFSIYNQDDISFGYKSINNKDSIIEVTKADFNQLKNADNLRNKAKIVFLDTLPVSLDECKIEMRVRNEYFEGISCNIFKIILYGSEGDIRLNLADEKCYDLTKIVVSELSYNDKTNNNEKLHRDFSLWTTISISTINNAFTLYFDDKEVYSTPYKNKLGRMQGFLFWFLEGGAVDYVKCYDKNNQLLYKEDFNK